MANSDAVWLNNAAVEIDVAEFERAVEASANPQTDLATRRALLEKAIGLYLGPLLPDVYEEWVLSEQTRLAQRFTLALAHLADMQEATGALELALSTARRAQQADPFQESPYQTEMRILASGGQQETARRVYQEFATYLYRELGCRPSPTFQAFLKTLDKIESREIVPAPGVNTNPHAPREAFLNKAPLPAPLTRFWGRENEVEQLVALMRDSAGPRLITLTGPGGIGKTHLSLMAGGRLAALEPKRRICWIPLADVSDERLFLTALLQALGGGASAENDPLQMLASTLAPSASESGVLLILDNMEQLVGDDETLGRVPALMRSLLERVGGLAVLVTSRRILGLAGEQEIPLNPLPTPQNEARRLAQATTNLLASLHAVPSVSLFVERARLARPDFSLSVANADTVAAICCRLEGMPLALEMAATWVRTLSLSQIRERLDTHVFALQSRRRDLPPRHRSLRATVEWSWELLDTDLRAFFLRLCVFRGGFNDEAAQAVVGVGDSSTLDGLARLQEHSLLSMRVDAENTERYFFLEPIREWGLEKLAENPTAYHAARAKHAHYFADKAHHAPDPSFVAKEEQNCVAALNGLMLPQPNGEYDPAQLREGLRLATASTFSWFYRGLYTLGYQFLPPAMEKYRQFVQGKGEAEDPLAFAKALHAWGNLLRFRGRLEEAERSFQDAQERFSQIGDLVQAARCEGDLGTIATERQDFARAASHYARAVELGRDLKNTPLIAVGLSHLATAVQELGELEAAHAHYEEAMQLFRSQNDEMGCGHLLLSQSLLSLQENKLERASHEVNEGLQIVGARNNPRLVALFLTTAAAVAVRRNHAHRAIRLFASSDRLIEESGTPLNERERRERERAMGDGTWRAHLSRVEITQAEEWGGADSLEDAIAYAQKVER